MKQTCSAAENELANVQKRLSASQLKGSLRIKKRGQRVEFYHIKNGTGKKVRYLKKAESDVVMQLAQLGYDRHLKKKLNQQVRGLNRCIKTLQDTDVRKIYGSSPVRRNLVQVKILSDEEYVAQWLKVPRKYLEYEEDQKKYPAKNGIRVRSKSEKIIADILCDLNIPFVYEACAEVYRNGRKIRLYPDFTLLDVRNRRQILFEHFGLLDKQEYVHHFIEKIILYTGSGYVMGDTLLFSVEMDEYPLNIQDIKTLLKSLVWH